MRFFFGLQDENDTNVFTFRAEKKFKKILAVLNKPADHLKVVKGVIKCMLCGETNFETEEEAIIHVTSEHDKNDGEFEASSDEEIHEAESADETEGSSGDVSSEIESSDSGDESADDGFVSSKKGKTSTAESIEFKTARDLMSEYVETLRGEDIVNMTIQWTQQL